MARWMAARGVPVVDADVVAREVVMPGTDGHRDVVEAFGPGVLSPDGSIDRKALGDVVFRDAEARRTLNAITHPRIGAESARRFSALGEQGHGFALYEAAVIIESGVHRGLGGVIVVTAQPEVQLARLMARDGAGEAAARARIAAQWPMARKVAEATWVIDNSHDRERLLGRVAALYATLVVRLGPPARTAPERRAGATL